MRTPSKFILLINHSFYRKLSVFRQSNVKKEIKKVETNVRALETNFNNMTDKKDLLMQDMNVTNEPEVKKKPAVSTSM